MESGGLGGLSLGLPLVAILGGYFFVSHCELIAYRFAHYSGHRFYFTAATAGVISLIAAQLIIYALARWPTSAIVDSYPFWPIYSVVTTIAVIASLLGHGSVRKWSLHEIDKVTAETTLQIVCIPLLLLFALGVINWPLLSGPVWPPLDSDFFFHSLLTLVAGMIAIGIGSSYSGEPWYVISLRMALVSALLFNAALVVIYWVDAVRSIWLQIIPLRHAGLFALSFFISLVAVYPINILFPRDVAKAIAVRKGRDSALDAFLYSASNSADIVQLNLISGKVYIGYVLWYRHALSSPDAYVSFLPIISGYRDEKTHELVLATFYHEVYTQAVGKRLATTLSKVHIRELAESFRKIVPVADIWLASLFSPKSYGYFQKRPMTASKKTRRFRRKREK